MESYVFGSFLFVLFSALIVLALGGNLLVCVAVYLDRNLRRQPENLYLVSLAVSDLLVSAMVMVFAAANDILSYWPFGRVYCHFWICLDIVCCSASILNLCAISLDRYWHISRPMLYVRYCSRKRICVAICLVWLLSAMIGTLQLAFGFARTDLNISAYDGSLELPTCQMNLPPMYAIGSSLLSFFLPATLMVLFYTRLYLYARKHVRSIRSQLRQATSFLIMQLASEKIREVTQATLNGEKLHNEDSSQGRNFKRFPDHRQVPVVKTKLKSSSSSVSAVSDQKARLTLGVIMGTFLICWMPFFVVNIWKSLYPQDVSLFNFQAVTWLGYANSTANPLIYSIFNRDFRRAFTKILRYFVRCEKSKSKNSFCGSGGKQSYRHRSPKHLREEPLWSLSSDYRPQSSNPNGSSFPLESETMNNNLSNGVVASCNSKDNTVQLRSVLHESSNGHLSSFSNNNNNEEDDDDFDGHGAEDSGAQLHSNIRQFNHTV